MSAGKTRVERLREEHGEQDRAVSSSGAGAKDGGAVPPTDASPSNHSLAVQRGDVSPARDFHVGPPVAAIAPIGERPCGLLWHTVRWTGNLTLLVGPGVTLVLDAASLEGIHEATGLAIASRAAASAKAVSC